MHSIFTDTYLLWGQEGIYTYRAHCISENHESSPGEVALWQLVAPCGPPPIPPCCAAAESWALASTLLSHLIALSCHLIATGALSSMILFPYYSPVHFGGYEKSRDHSPRERMDEEGLAVPPALGPRKQPPAIWFINMPVAFENWAPLLHCTAHWMDKEGRSWPGTRSLSRSLPSWDTTLLV